MQHIVAEPPKPQNTIVASSRELKGKEYSETPEKGKECDETIDTNRARREGMAHNNYGSTSFPA